MLNHLPSSVHALAVSKILSYKVIILADNWMKFCLNFVSVCFAFYLTGSSEKCANLYKTK